MIVMDSARFNRVLDCSLRDELRNMYSLFT
jgi:hypothetical protein